MRQGSRIHVAGHSKPVRSKSAELTEQALINHIALGAFSGDAWLTAYRDRPARPIVRIPEQRTSGLSPVTQWERNRIEVARRARSER